ncbi:MAG: phenylalanine--tRNA ligase subunit beta [Paludibacteraceae bacterium]|nr:phenylalanine--tRNA ligase subunit beta [Paludibacteraceae bacterium]
MNISYNWLKRYISLPDDAEKVATILTSIGLEVGTVEQVQSIRGGLKGLVVGHVLTCVEHPNSDHLHITTVDLGTPDSPVQIVCGAPNVAAGQKVIVATIGTMLYSGEESFTIKKGKIRGEESWGMICAEDEIGVGTDHAGIMVLPQDTPVGMPASEYFHLENDTLIEVDITPNRSDAISHYGVARDLYAYYQAHGQNNVTLTRPDESGFSIDEQDSPITVRVENAEACPRYSGVMIRGVQVKESPDWLKKALTTIGLRPINNIVDITNFVLHEYGQALHAFDAGKIAGRTVIVKNCAEGTPFTTLDGVERKLSAADLMICNESEPMCIAGVFGGLDSGVTEQTTDIFIESAYFHPVGIRKTARRHQLQTDASFRYERGCDPNNTLHVLRRCAALVREIAGGTVCQPVDVQNGKQCPVSDAVFMPPFEVEFSLERCHQLIGKQLDEDMIATILRALEIEIIAKQGDVWRLGVPRYRVDVQRECDVVEDILRIYGYNNVEFPDKLNTNLSYGVKPDPQRLQTRISEQLSAQGFYEILNNSLTKVAYYEYSGNIDSCVKILNPLSQDLGVLRQTLLFGGLETIQRNANRKNADLKLYEFGNCYHYDKAKLEKQQTADAQGTVDPLRAYSEEMHLGVWITGNKTLQSWVMKEQKSTFYELRAYVENVLRRLGVNINALVYTPIEPSPLFADGLVVSAQNGKRLGELNIVSRELRKMFDIDNPVFFADLDWRALLKQNKQYKPVITDLPKFPAVKRDFALLVDKTVQFADLARLAYQTEKKYLKNVYLFDVYEGKNLDAGKKSYALSFILQDEQDTLKDKQIEAIMTRLQKAFEDTFGATLR